MAKKKKAEPADHTKPAGRKIDVLTVRVAKDLVSLARKIAVLRNVSQEDYITPLLALCADKVEAEVKKKGILAVRDRAEAVRDIEKFNGGYSTFNTSPEVATRLTSLAGQCLTSVAKLIDHQIRGLLELDLLAATREIQVLQSTDPFDANYKAYLTQLRAEGRYTPIWEDIAGISHAERIAGGAMFTFYNPGFPSLVESGVEPGKNLILRRKLPSAGDVVLVNINKLPYMADIKESPDGKLEIHPRTPKVPVLKMKAGYLGIEGVFVGFSATKTDKNNPYAQEKITPDKLREYAINLHESAGWQPVEITGPSLLKYGYRAGDILMVKPDAQLQAGDVVVIDVGGELSLRTVMLPGNTAQSHRSSPYPDPIELDDARRSMIGVLGMSYRPGPMQG